MYICQRLIGFLNSFWSPWNDWWWWCDCYGSSSGRRKSVIIKTIKSLTERSVYSIFSTLCVFSPSRHRFTGRRMTFLFFSLSLGEIVTLMLSQFAPKFEVVSLANNCTTKIYKPLYSSGAHQWICSSTELLKTRWHFTYHVTRVRRADQQDGRRLVVTAKCKKHLTLLYSISDTNREVDNLNDREWVC